MVKTLPRDITNMDGTTTKHLVERSVSVRFVDLWQTILEQIKTQPCPIVWKLEWLEQNLTQNIRLEPEHSGLKSFSYEPCLQMFWQTGFFLFHMGAFEEYLSNLITWKE